MSGIGRIVAFLLALFVINVVMPVHAERVEMSVEVGFGGYVVPGRWNPLRLELLGETGAGRIEFHRQDRNRRPVIERFDLSAVGNGLIIECPVFSGETGSRLQVKWFDGKRLLAESTVDTAKRIFPGHLVLTVGVPPPVEETIEESLSEQEPILTAAVALIELPQSTMGYDGVSAIVMTDPGPLLNPAQLRSIRSWLAGGGQLVLRRPRPGNSGIASALLPQLPTAQKISWGLGKISFMGKFDEEAKEAWQGVIKLAPFITDYRLTPSRIFIDEGLKVSPLPKSPWLPGLFVTIWAMVGIVLSRMPRRSLRWWLLFSLIASFLAFSYSQWLALRWYRGASVQTRAVYLPGTNGAYFDCHVNPLYTGKWVGVDYQPLPWDITVDSDWDETGLLSPGKDTPLYWCHSTVQSRWHVLSDDTGGMNLQGWLPSSLDTSEKLADSLIRSALSVAWWDGTQWFTPSEDQDQDGWQPIEEVPEWFVEQNQWFQRIQQISPQLGWLVGYGALPQESWYVQKTSVKTAWWVLPLPVEVAE
jgi:hypothetical protein